MKTSAFKILSAISFGGAFTYVTLGHYYQAGAMIALTAVPKSITQLILSQSLKEINSYELY